MAGACTGDVSFFTFQGGPDDPTEIKILAVQEEIFVIRALQLVNLRYNVNILDMALSKDIYWSAHADQASGLVLPLAISMSFFGCSTQGYSQAAGR